MSQVRQLVDILACSEQRARELLSETQGRLEDAVSLFYAQPSRPAPQSPR